MKCRRQMGVCGLQTSLKFIIKANKINKGSLFIFVLSSKCVKIARLAIQQNPIK